MKLPQLQTKLQEFSNIKCSLKLSYATRDLYTELLLKWDRAAWAEGIKVSDRELMFAIGTSDWKVITRAKNQLRKCQLIYFIANKGVPTQYFLTESAYQTAVDSAEVTAVHSAVHSAVFSTAVFPKEEFKKEEKGSENQAVAKNNLTSEVDVISSQKNMPSYTTTYKHNTTTVVDRDRDRECKGEEKEKGLKKPKEDWRLDYNVYLAGANAAKEQLMNDQEFIIDRETYYPFCDIRLSIQKMFVDYWATEDGWQNKKDKRTKSISWKSTVIKNLGIKNNRVSKTTNNGTNQIKSDVRQNSPKGERNYDQDF